MNLSNLFRASDYIERLRSGRPVITNGHVMSKTDQRVRDTILGLMCQGKTEWADHNTHPIYDGVELRLKPMLDDQLILLEKRNGYTALSVTAQGRPFVRNICMAFDPNLEPPSQQTAQASRIPLRFSATI